MFSGIFGLHLQLKKKQNLQALTNEANELLPIFNKTTSKFYRTSVPTGDWSNQATHIGDRQISTQTKKHQLPQSAHEALTRAL